MGAPSSDELIPPENRKWYRLGVGVSIGWAVFIVVLLVLLQLDTTAGLVFAIAGSVIFGIVFTLFVLYVY